MTATFLGRIGWSMDRSEEGHRDYRLLSRVGTTDPEDGPAIVFGCAGLPAVGDAWAEGNDSDPWAFCWPTMKISPLFEGEKQQVWQVENLFTTRPFRRCQDTPVEDPLLEPAKIGGSFQKYTQEAKQDRHGNPVLSSSHEPLRGVEQDFNRPSVQISVNTSALELDVFSAMVDHVNDADLWGLPPRCIKLSDVSWERVYYGVCYPYYRRTMSFDVNFNTFDPKIPDFGSKWLKPGGDPSNPYDFIVFKDDQDENTHIPLDGAGLPVGYYGAGDQHIFNFELYPEANFLLLGIPTDL